MTDEEKKAIKYFNNKIGDFELRYGKKITTEDNEHSKILLKLIEKQSKEIEELKEIKWYYEISRVSKSKIKAKIEEMEKEKEKYFEKQVIQHEIEVLQSLLEEEKR